MFPERLKALRLEANLTQNDIAKSLNISQPSYAQWENGRRKPSSETLEKFAQFYNVSTDYLLGKSDYKNSDEIDLSTFEVLYRKTSKNLYHTWAEVYIQGVGWIPVETRINIPVDINKGYFGITNKHIKIYEGVDFEDINVKLYNLDIDLKVLNKEEFYD